MSKTEESRRSLSKQTNSANLMMAPSDDLGFHEGNTEWLLHVSNNGEAEPNPKSDCLRERRLAKWVAHQHSEHSKLKCGRPSDLDADKVKILQQAGFPFKLTRDEQWEANFDLVRSFAETNGHCKMPRDHTVNGKKIGDWLHNRKKELKKHLNDQKTPLTKPRAMKLLSIGVGELKKDWNASFVELMAYKEVHGNCVVPQSYAANKPLARWVKHQREQYQLAAMGERSTLTVAKVSKLDAIGFDFMTAKLATPQWDHHPELDGSSLLDALLDGEHLNLVVTKKYRGVPAVDALTRYFLDVSSTVYDAVQEGKSPPPLFQILQLEGVVFVQNEQGAQLGNAGTSWNSELFLLVLWVIAVATQRSALFNFSLREDGTRCWQRKSELLGSRRRNLVGCQVGPKTCGVRDSEKETSVWAKAVQSASCQAEGV